MRGEGDGGVRGPVSETMSRNYEEAAGDACRERDRTGQRVRSLMKLRGLIGRATMTLEEDRYGSQTRFRRLRRKKIQFACSSALGKGWRGENACGTICL